MTKMSFTILFFRFHSGILTTDRKADHPTGQYKAVTSPLCDWLVGKKSPFLLAAADIAQ